MFSDKRKGPLFDVRSPKEYSHAHIPGAINLPLFSDAERAVVGTLYKKEGKQRAIREGVKIVGPKLDELLSKALEHTTDIAEVYCWRGGMRSGFMRYFLQFAGISTTQLEGGYKVFRRFVRDTLAKPYKIQLIGGLTGSGKTEALHQITKEQVIDLEELACHSGSVFGGLHGKACPSNEHFENELALRLSQLDSSKVIWLEDESRLIGHCQIPNELYEAMKKAPLYLIKTTKEERIARIMEQYGRYGKELLKEASIKLAKRLGGEVTKKTIEHIEANRYEDAIWLLLDYYDKAYEYALKKHKGPLLNYPKM